MGKNILNLDTTEQLNEFHLRSNEQSNTRGCLLNLTDLQGHSANMYKIIIEPAFGLDDNTNNKRSQIFKLPESSNKQNYRHNQLNTFRFFQTLTIPFYSES